MYYLLEDNRIIKGERLSHWEEVGKDRNFIVFINGEFKSVGKIKAQSENVADFIEVGDLIRYDNDFMGTYIIGEVYLNCGELETRDEQRIKRLDIHEIYKPDKHGNYIKVWERGNENA